MHKIEVIYSYVAPLQVTKRIDKDRFSAFSYGLWYIKNFEDKSKKREPIDISQIRSMSCVATLKL
jgi:hypothetical protein